MSIVSSSTSLAAASIMATKSAVEATVTAISESSLSSALGLIINSPSISPTETPETGPFQGISDMETATETPSIAVISGAQSGSTDITVATTLTSLRISFGNKGRMGLSITREARMAFSLALPSLR